MKAIKYIFKYIYKVQPLNYQLQNTWYKLYLCFQGPDKMLAQFAENAIVSDGTEHGRSGNMVEQGHFLLPDGCQMNSVKLRVRTPKLTSEMYLRVPNAKRERDCERTTSR